MSSSKKGSSRTPITRVRKLKLGAVLIFLAVLTLSYSQASMQNPVFNPQIDIDQDKLLAGDYPLMQVLQAGGQFWTTPYTQYNAQTNLGDGYGEGPDGPRAWQRHLFNKNTTNYTFLRLNGLDSQSCYECHNSIGSDPGYGPGSPLIRKQPSSVGGSAGFNSTAFINPCFPNPLTLFIRSPPHVYGSGYVQTVGDEITYELYKLRATVRNLAKNNPGKPQTIPLVDKVHGLNFGSFTTTYTGKGKWMPPLGNKSACPQPACPTCPLPGCDNPPPVGKSSPQLLGKFSAQRSQARTTAARGAKLATVSDNTDLGAIMVDGFTDDTTNVTGVSFDLIVRPFQWKGVASSIRHFVRDALDFHLSMQAVEKVGDINDCDKDGKIKEVSLGNVSAMAAFVGMTRPPQQMVPPGVSNDSVSRGYAIFTGKIPGLAPKAQQMCATCHIPTLPLSSPTPQFNVDTAVSYPGTDCPTEATGSYNSLIAPLRNHTLLPVVKRIKAQSGITSDTTVLSYPIPLNSTDVPAADLPRLAQTGPQKSLFFLPFLPQPPAGTFNVPLFSDLQTHDMGTLLADPTAQGSDVMGVCIQPRFFLTRPLWGVADTGPWLHDGRATSLLEAILMHGDSKTGSEAAPIVEAFNSLSDGDKQNLVNFLLSLRLPVESPQTGIASHRY